MNEIHIGIDPGTKTGLAIVKNGELVEVKTCTIVQAMTTIKILWLERETNHITLHVENPNLRKHFGNTGREKLQGAGSIKRDFAIWEEFSKEYGIKMHGIAPRQIGSDFDNEIVFQLATGWKSRTSNHARDAVKIVFRYLKKP